MLQHVKGFRLPRHLSSSRYICFHFSCFSVLFSNTISMVVNSFTFLCHLFTVNLNNSVQRFIALHSPKLKFQCTERNIKSSRRLLFYCTYIYISSLVSFSLSFSRLRFIQFLLAAVHIRRKHIWNASNGSQPNWGANQTNKLNRNTEQQKKGKKN